MRFENVFIESLGYDTPPEVLSSADIESELSEVYQRLRLPEGRLELMTGIQERRYYPVDTAPSGISAAAGEAALAKSAFKREDIELVCHAAVCRDRLEPSTASYVHGRLGLAQHAQIWDLSNACLGFLNAMAVVAGLIESGQVKRALVCSGENGRSLMNWTLNELKRPEQTRKSVKKYFANLTIGAGGVAAVLCHRDELGDRHGIQIKGTALRTDSQANMLCEGGNTGGELEMLTDSEELLVAGIRLAKNTWSAFEKELGWTRETPDRFICHQVGTAHRRQLFENLGLPLDRDFITYPEWGNVGSVSCPLTLAKALEAGTVKPGDQVAMLGIGSGLSCMMMGVEA